MLRIDTNFPGGNIKLFECRGNHFSVAPDLRDTTSSWFYWAFRLSNCRSHAGETLSFSFVSDNPVGVHGAAYSLDNRHSWAYSNPEPFGTNFFTFTIPFGVDEIYLSMAPLYTQIEWDRFLASLPHSELESSSFAISRQGRPVELLHVGATPENASFHAILTARHHCCEMMANFVIEGFISFLLSNPSKDARWLRNNLSLSIIPFIDKDGVENGDQGKNRAPHDHARDYAQKSPLYPETIATTKLVKSVIKRFGKLDFIADIHCPGIRDYENQSVYMVGKAHPSDPIFRKKFGTILKRVLPHGSLPYDTKNDIPFGVGWNCPKSVSQGSTLIAWAGKFVGVKAAASFEIPYADASGTLVLANSARAFGAAMATALSRYLIKSIGN